MHLVPVVKDTWLKVLLPILVPILVKVPWRRVSREMEHLGRSLQQRPHGVVLLSDNGVVTGGYDVLSSVEEVPVHKTLLAHVLWR